MACRVAMGQHGSSTWFRLARSLLMRGVADARIWYQSFTDPDADRPYFTRLQAYLGVVASPGCQVEVVGIQPGSRYPHPITEFRCAARAIARRSLQRPSQCSGWAST
jgi:hypothetical protein